MQVSEWDALFSCHTKYQTADSVPFTPIPLHANDRCTHTMHGMPVACETLWSKLAGRFPRPHHTPADSSTHASSDGGCVSVAASAGGVDCLVDRSESAVALELLLPLVNNMTGLNHRPAERARAKSFLAVRTRVLYLIAIDNFEGMRVGLGHAEAAVCPDTGGRQVGWLGRRNWSNDPNSAGFLWSDAPSSDVARKRDDRCLLQSFEPIESVLPVQVKLTSAAKNDPALPLNHRQIFRLLKTCVTQLLEFCKLRRPALLRVAADVAPTCEQTS
eukprot:1590334-Pleurochrysis_carterae.AAC.1